MYFLMQKDGNFAKIVMQWKIDDKNIGPLAQNDINTMETKVLTR